MLRMGPFFALLRARWSWWFFGIEFSHFLLARLDVRLDTLKHPKPAYSLHDQNLLVASEIAPMVGNSIDCLYDLSHWVLFARSFLRLDYLADVRALIAHTHLCVTTII